MNISIGQGWVTVTPLQIANVIAMIANEGIVYKPRVLKEIRHPATGEVIRTIEKEVLTRAFFSKETIAQVQTAMRKVITEGTGYLVSTKAVQVAGKTGTPETGEEDVYHSWFASYAPYDSANIEDRIVVVAIIESSNKEEWWASKTANIIYQGIFANQTFEEAMVALYPWTKSQYMSSQLNSQLSSQ
jgi:penicillin-binding protein 2